MYLYNKFPLPFSGIGTIGFSYDRYTEEDLEVSELNPKLGLEWDIAENARLRLAAFRSVKRALAADQTIEPTQVAGFNQFFDDFNGTVAWRYGIGLDARLRQDLYGGVELSARKIDEPVFGATEDRREELLRSYLSWTPAPRWALGLALEYDRFRNDDPVNIEFPKRLDTISMPLSARYFHPSGWFAETSVTFVHHDVGRRPDTGVPDGSDRFVLLDALLGYRLPHRRGIISLEGRNLLNEDFGFEDDNFRISEPRNSRYIPDRMVLARLTLSF
jgi:hypothetical protein